MGNTNSSSGTNTFEGKVKLVATQFILTQDYESMRNMASNASYCNQIQKLASTLIKQNMTLAEIAKFAQQVTASSSSSSSSVATPTNPLKQPSQQQDCTTIAKYFTLVAHLFSAIMTTVNPLFYYTNERGKLQRGSLTTKQNLPQNANAKYVVEGSFCTRRIDALTTDNFSQTASDDVVSPRI